MLVMFVAGEMNWTFSFEAASVGFWIQGDSERIWREWLDHTVLVAEVPKENSAVGTALDCNKLKTIKNERG